MKNNLIYIFTSFVLLLISSCSSTKQISKYDNVKGKLIESGIASWYGPNFDGKQTANGETFNMYEMTAAHRTLPFNSMVQVINKSNGKSVIVRINDRGPYAKNRIIDLSKGAAQIIDMVSDGFTEVELYLLSNNKIPNKIDTPYYTVQIGSFKERDDAHKLARMYKMYHASRVVKANVRGEIYFRVYIGLFDKIKEAEEFQKLLKNKGADGFVKQVEN